MADTEASSDREPLRLDYFLKSSGAADTGGQAKVLIQSEQVRVNGEIETRRRRKLVIGDVVEVAGNRFTVDHA
ncbi:MAG: RNA-binding S4 domain-containing protein [Planctomycetaceae bacterium]|nr:RNA-binding S4 domain-containing protein [Planctomycetaceae bacterium]